MAAEKRPISALFLGKSVEEARNRESLPKRDDRAIALQIVGTVGMGHW